MLAKLALLVFRVRSLLTGRPFRRFFAKPECKPAAYRPLPTPLPRGEGTNWPETPKMVGFQHPQSPLPRGEGTKLVENPKMVGFRYPQSPLPVGEGSEPSGLLFSDPRFCRSSVRKLLTCSRTAKGRPAKRLRTLKVSGGSFH